jgi:hypothetical protein
MVLMISVRIRSDYNHAPLSCETNFSGAAGAWEHGGGQCCLYLANCDALLT